MNNYFKFTNFAEDKESFECYNSLSSNILNTHLDASFIYIENYLNYFASVFKDIFKGSDYDEFYYSCKILIEELNDVKIILNIIMERDKND